GAVLTLTGPALAELHHGPDRLALAVEGVSAAQAAAIAARLAESASSASAAEPASVLLCELLEAGSGSSGRAAQEAEGLAVPIGREGVAVASVDLVADGPHAVVAGVTGSGKSELLVTWVAALCATRPPSHVSFLLADFKGGTAFDRLASLPHVTGVITDLDAGGARRAVESLRAELRRREGELARVGARDIRDARVGLPHLVIVVDEFAALLAEHPELHAVFADVAARGRALGMHLVLGTQRVSGVVRDALLANCPLRVSLRVTEPGDSRAVIGTDDAARLPGDASSRGLAYVRRAGDARPGLVRIALTEPADVERIAATAARDAPVHRPWLPGLPARLRLDEVGGVRAPDELVLGIADEPEAQRQPVVTLRQGVDRGIAVVGAARSGKSTVLELLAAQAPGATVRVPIAPEAAWDAVAALAEAAPRGALVLVDDLDALAGAFPADYAAELLARLERVVRGAGAHRLTVVVAAQRASGPVGRIAELLPQRALLPHATRLDHVGAGGDPAAYDAGAPPGRAVLGGRMMQFAMVDAGAPSPTVGPPPPLWEPRDRVSVLAVRSPGACAPALAAALPGHRVVRLDELPPAARVEDLRAGDATRRGGASRMERIVVVGEPDGWQRQWGLWQRAHADGGAVVAAACAAEFRGLTGVRELPPYAVGDDRAWHVRATGAVERVRLPGLGADGEC
ncbi:MAG: FtsK/SpoIIIE domain-containing protein, partial [Microbacterium sp.]